MQAITTTDKREAEAGADRTFLRIALALQIEVQQGLDQLNDNVFALVRQYSAGNQVQQRDKLITAVSLAIDGYSDDLDALIELYVKKLADERTNQGLTTVIPILRSAGADHSVVSFKSQLSAYPDDAVKRFRHVRTGDYDLTYTDRMKAITESGQKTIGNIIRYDVEKGVDSNTLAFHLASYLDPAPTTQKGRPWEIARQAMGVSSKYIPKNTLPGAYQANVYNIERSTAAEVYRRATNDLYDQKWFTDGYRWVLSGSHPHTDVCDELAAASPYPTGGVRPYSHPYCLCDWRVILKSSSDIRQLVKSGQFS